MLFRNVKRNITLHEVPSTPKRCFSCFVFSWKSKTTRLSLLGGQVLNQIFSLYPQYLSLVPGTHSINVRSAKLRLIWQFNFLGFDSS